VACWTTKAAISLKRVKIEEKLQWTAYRNSPMLFRTVPSTTPYGLPFLKIGVCNLATPLISGTGKSTDFKFGGYIYRANPNNRPLKILKKMEHGHIQGLPTFFGYPLLFPELVMLQTSNLAGTFTGPFKMLEKRERGRIQGLPKFFGYPYYLRNR